MQEKAIGFPGPAGQIEGRFACALGDNRGTLVVLHPHPQYGGSMSNNVVKAVARAGQQVGLATLRFNFRGVGRSEGGFDGGVGEQGDIAAALGFVRQETGVYSTILAGYSFGACVALAFCHMPNHEIDHLFLIAPPPFLLPKHLSVDIPVIRKILLGEYDQLAPPKGVSALISQDRKEALLEVIPGTDHFFGGHEKELEKLLQGFFAEAIDMAEEHI